MDAVRTLHRPQTPNALRRRSTRLVPRLVRLAALLVWAAAATVRAEEPARNPALDPPELADATTANAKPVRGAATTTDAQPTETTEAEEALAARARMVLLPDEPGTVPLRERSIEDREDRTDLNSARQRKDKEPQPGRNDRQDRSLRREPRSHPDGEDRVDRENQRIREDREAVESRPRRDDLPLPGNLPPLSLEDCVKALAWAGSELESPSPDPRASAGEVRFPLRQVLAYLKIQDERHSSLADYEWIFIEEEKVSGTPMDEDRFNDRQVDDVSAVSLHATGGDVLVHRVRILDDRDQMAAEYHLDPPLLLRSDLPRREVFHLYFPTRVKEVVVQYQGAEERDKPRVSVFAGLAQRREYLKQAQYYLRRALSALEAGERAEAADLLNKTARRITRFQERY